MLAFNCSLIGIPRTIPFGDWRLRPSGVKPAEFARLHQARNGAINELLELRIVLAQHASIRLDLRRIATNASREPGFLSWPSGRIARYRPSQILSRAVSFDQLQGIFIVFAQDDLNVEVSCRRLYLGTFSFVLPAWWRPSCLPEVVFLKVCFLSACSAKE